MTPTQTLSSTTDTQTTCSCGDIEFQAALFKALGHPIRLKIVMELMDKERCVCELHENTGRDMSTISSHLKTLKNAQIIRSRQDGKNIFYSLSYPCLRSVFRCLNEQN